MISAKKILLLSILLAYTMSLSAGAQNPAPGKAGPAGAKPAASPLSEKYLFFTEPFSYLKPPVKDVMGMSLDLDYTIIKYDYGFVNTADLKPESLVAFKKRMVIKEPKQLARITEKTGLTAGAQLTVISALGNVSTAKIVSFSYVGNSPSTIIVTADLKIEGQSPDPSLFAANGIALRGKWPLPSQQGLRAGPPLANTDPLKPKLVTQCSGDIGPRFELQGPQVVPAPLKPGGAISYFVSFWLIPKGNYEIEDVELKSCFFQSSGQDYWTNTPLPVNLRLLQVYDLDGDGQAELFGLSGNGLEVCLAYLAPQDNEYRVVKKGLCAGY